MVGNWYGKTFFFVELDHFLFAFFFAVLQLGFDKSGRRGCESDEEMI